jgi:hypothetical protein
MLDAASGSGTSPRGAQMTSRSGRRGCAARASGESRTVRLERVAATVSSVAREFYTQTF